MNLKSYRRIESEEEHKLHKQYSVLVVGCIYCEPEIMNPKRIINIQGDY